MESVWIFKLGLSFLMKSISNTKQSNLLWHFLKTVNWLSLKRLLFNLYINDLPSAVKSSCTDSYVDDTKIYCSFSAKNMNSCLVKMTEDLGLFAGWCCSHQLLINPSKTKLIFFGTRQLLSKVSDIRVPFLDQELTPVSSVKDLGITLDSYLTFNNHMM